MSAPETSCAPRGAGDFCLSCLLTSGLLVVAVVASFAYLQIDFGALFSREAAVGMGEFVASFFPPASAPPFLAKTALGALQTFAVAAVGTLLAALLGVLCALPAAGRAGGALRQVARFALNVLRSVPELVWALVFVRVVGLGPTAGVLAIALTYSGMLGKVYGEILESGETHATTTLLRNGSGRLQAFLYGLLPTNAPELTSYTVYRWECAIRSSAVLGFVGAGGLGQQMDVSMKMFAGAEVSTMLLAFMLLVWLADLVSSTLREALG